jgi:hypothetical protein
VGRIEEPRPFASGEGVGGEQLRIGIDAQVMHVNLDDNKRFPTRNA